MLIAEKQRLTWENAGSSFRSVSRHLTPVAVLVRPRSGPKPDSSRDCHRSPRSSNETCVLTDFGARISISNRFDRTDACSSQCGPQAREGACDGTDDHGKPERSPVDYKNPIPDLSQDAHNDQRK